MSSNISWKEKSLYQIISSVKMNTNSTIISPENLHKSPPLKIYRRESTPHLKTNCSSRLGITIRQLENPNGYVSSVYNLDDSLVINYKDVNKNNQKNICIPGIDSVQTNAVKRIRTSGIINKNYNADTNQYLQRRKISFQQSQNNYLESGNINSKPGTIESHNNIYTNGYIYKPNNSQFACQGSVSSSALIERKKYNTITSNAGKSILPFGSAVANAMAYGISDSIFTYKNKLAFPTKITPISKKNTETMQFCSITSFKR
jgi:hypothetical protein